MDQSLFKLTKDYLALQELDDDEAVLDTIEGLKGTIQIKSVNVAKYISNLNASALAIDNAMKQMDARKKALKNKAERVRKYLKDSMEANKIHRIEAPEFVLKIVKNPPKLISNPDLVPNRFKDKEISFKLRTKEIKEELKKGKEIQGCRLENSTRLQIK